MVEVPPSNSLCPIQKLNWQIIARGNNPQSPKEKK